jgi:hypothetical protein
LLFQPGIKAPQLAFIQMVGMYNQKTILPAIKLFFKFLDLVGSTFFAGRYLSDLFPAVFDKSCLCKLRSQVKKSPVNGR